MMKSRWWIYLALREAGINTSIGYALLPRKNTPTNNYLDNEWTPMVGKSPKKIAEVSGIKLSTIVSAIRKRRDSLANKVEHLPLKNYEGLVTFVVNPYM